MIEAGKVLQNRYRVDKQIGQGGMGVVFIAIDERFGSTVAIKETFFTDEKLRKAFEREARLLNSLRHPALPRVSDHFIEGNGQFLVMEYIDGDDLFEQLDADGKTFAISDILTWADQLLDALEYLHTQEMPVIHRDIKPQNLKLNSRGQIILLDFGLAKGNSTSPESATAAKSVVGYSRNYASIEQIQGSGTDPRSDLYSLSATLYHLLTGCPPADALTRAMNVLSGKPDPLIDAARIRPDIPAAFSHILTSSMALSADERPDSAQTLRKLIANHDSLTSPNLVATGTAAIPSTDIYSQKTEVHPEAAQVQPVFQSNIKTETFSNEDSKVTSLKPESSTGGFVYQNSAIQPLASIPPKKSRRGLAIGATLGALVLAGSAASAIFVYPEMFGASSKPANIERESPVVDSPVQKTSVTAANVVTENSNVNSVSAVSATNRATVANTKDSATKNDAKVSEVKPPDAPKTEVRQTPATATVVEPPRPKNLPQPADEDRPPETSPNGQRIPPAVWQKMTPRQRRQLRQALELERQQQNEPRPNQPRPQPPPDN